MAGIVGEILDRKEKPSVVKFVRDIVEDKLASEKAGRFVGRDVDFAHVTAPYSTDIWKAEVKDWFANLENDFRNQRIPQEWLDLYKKQYEAFKNGQELPLNGTPIKGWGVISPAKQEELVRMNILTVEMLADVNDEGIRRIGMGSIELKDKARAWLAQLSDKGPLTQEVASLKTENRNLSGEVEALKRQVELLMQKVKSPAVVTEDEGSFYDKDDLVAQYTEKFGEKPHHRMKEETIRAKLKE